MRGKPSAFRTLITLLVALSAASLALSCGRGASRSPTVTPAGTPLPVNEDDPVQVYVMNVDGQPQLVTTLNDSLSWAWAPDDDHAALVTDIANYSARVHVISVKGRTDIVNVGIAGRPRRLAWSPDGEWLALESSTADTMTVEAMRADGSDRRQLASGADGPEYGEVFAWAGNSTLVATMWEGAASDKTGLPTDQQLFEFDLARGSERQFTQPKDAAVAEVSRDASRVVFVVSGGQQGCPYGEFAASLWVMDVSDGSLHQVLPDTCQLNSASWSPDGSQIAYAVGTTDDTAGTYILDTASGISRKIDSTPALFDRVELWSQGDSILVQRSRCTAGEACPYGPIELVAVPVGEGNEENVADGPLYQCSPSGGAVAIHSNGLQIVRVPGTVHQVMAGDPSWNVSALGWSPDGEWFAFARSRATPTPAP
ncbi:MAG: hypothetical protein ABSC13_08480 [Dehalococcoidia bacterium]|jgi:Tol biopolymer transport system component